MSTLLYPILTIASPLPPRRPAMNPNYYRFPVPSDSFQSGASFQNQSSDTFGPDPALQTNFEYDRFSGSYGSFQPEALGQSSLQTLDTFQTTFIAPSLSGYDATPYRLEQGLSAGFSSNAGFGLYEQPQVAGNAHQYESDSVSLPLPEAHLPHPERFSSHEDAMAAAAFIIRSTSREEIEYLLQPTMLEVVNAAFGWDHPFTQHVYLLNWSSLYMEPFRGMLQPPTIPAFPQIQGVSNNELSAILPFANEPVPLAAHEHHAFPTMQGASGDALSAIILDQLHVLDHMTTTGSSTGHLLSVSIVDENVFTARLPTELWIKIFSMAIRVPGDTMDPVPPYSIPGVPASLHQWPREAEMMDRRRIALNLALVCRSWWDIAAKFLYRTVFIQNSAANPERVANFCLALQLSSMKRGAYGNGTLIDFLLIEAEVCSVHEVGTILRLCPRLRTFIIKKKNYWSLKEIGQFIYPGLHANKNLCRAEWKAISFGRRVTGKSIIMAKSMANLLPESVRAYEFYCQAAPKDVSGKGVRYANLVDLTVHGARRKHLEALQDWELPSLTHLSIDVADTLDINSVHALLKIHGKNLQFLHLDVYTATSVFAALKELCPSLAEYVIPAHRTRSFSDALVPPRLSNPTITHLVLAMQDCLWRGWDDLYITMDRILGFEMPALRCVRVLVDRNPSRLFLPAEITIFKRQFQERGIAVEDQDGLDLLDEKYPVKVPAHLRGLDFLIPVDSDGYLEQQ